MKAKNVLLAVLVASAVQISESELEQAHACFVQDLKAEEGRI